MLGLTLTDNAFQSAADNLTNGLVAWWKLDEGIGTTTKDSSGHNISGSLVNSPTWTAGRIGGGLQFNGTTNYVSGSNIAVTGSITLCAWMKCNWPSAKYRPIVSINYGQFAGVGLVTTGGNDMDWGTLGFLLVGNGWQPATHFPRSNANYGNLTSGSWHHVAGVMTPTSNQIYLDGVALPISSSITSSIVAQTNVFTLGGSPITNDWNDGALDDVRIYNRALSQTEINQIYNILG